MKINLEGQRVALDSYANFHEGPNNSNPFGPWQGVGNNQAWCDSSAQWGACVGGAFDGWDAHCQFGHKGSAYVPYTITDAQRIGLWRAKSSGYSPKPGDQEIYDWEGNGVADHIAGRWMARRPDGSHVTWEGNHNDRAGYVVRDDRYVVGWVALSSIADVVPAPPQPTHPHNHARFLKEDDTMAQVIIPPGTRGGFVSARGKKSSVLLAALGGEGATGHLWIERSDTSTETDTPVALVNTKTAGYEASEAASVVIFENSDKSPVEVVLVGSNLA